MNASEIGMPFFNTGYLNPQKTLPKELTAMPFNSASAGKNRMK